MQRSCENEAAPFTWSIESDTSFGRFGEVPSSLAATRVFGLFIRFDEDFSVLFASIKSWVGVFISDLGPFSSEVGLGPAVTSLGVSGELGSTFPAAGDMGMVGVGFWASGFAGVGFSGLGTSGFTASGLSDFWTAGILGGSTLGLVSQTLTSSGLERAGLVVSGAEVGLGLGAVGFPWSGLVRVGPALGKRGALVLDGSTAGAMDDTCSGLVTPVWSREEKGFIGAREAVVGMDRSVGVRLGLTVGVMALPSSSFAIGDVGWGTAGLVSLVSGAPCRTLTGLVSATLSGDKGETSEGNLLIGDKGLLTELSDNFSSSLGLLAMATVVPKIGAILRVDLVAEGTLNFNAGDLVGETGGGVAPSAAGEGSPPGGVVGVRNPAFGAENVGMKHLFKESGWERYFGSTHFSGLNIKAFEPPAHRASASPV